MAQKWGMLREHFLYLLLKLGQWYDFNSMNRGFLDSIMGIITKNK